ncbi:DUF5703 domain-containing protein [Edaphobacter flagellatus]|uniref:DUF5703 domain-containing protein n=1 Tax=Edaphobacter flagellatus TaxID=1933044 RepID=UPI0021B220A5|nr:DUF5703 domain-containing protein [Edaphobacter flagellatus]
MNRRQFSKAAGAFLGALTAKQTWATVHGAASEDAPLPLVSRIRAYNPVWNSPSHSSLDSMPLSGSKGTALNVWVQDGALYFYIARNDAYNEDGNLDKLGCIRLRLDPNPLADAKVFRQQLDIYTSRITVHAEDAIGQRCDILLWLDVSDPVVLVEARTSAAAHLEIAFMTWRDQLRNYAIDNWNFPGHKNVDPKLRHATADQVEAAADGLLWFHRNDNSGLVVERLIAKQKFEAKADTIVDPSRDLIYGGMLRGSSLQHTGKEPLKFQQWEGTAWSYRSRNPSTTHHATIALACEQAKDLDAWKHNVTALASRFESSAARQASKRRAEQWWSEFWNRSYIFINANKGADDIGWQVGRNYQLFRYMLACNRGGNLPLKFNGGIFNVDTANPAGYKSISGAPSDAAPPDCRRWGNLFMAQNQRLVGWPGLLSGDFDLMTPSLDFYAERVHTAAARSQLYWQHNGAAFMEPLSLYGLPVESLSTDHGPCSSKHLAWHFSIQIEFAWMALEWARYSGHEIKPYLTLIESVVRFYDEHYRKETKARTGNEYGPDGKLVLFPMNCIELYTNTTNPIEVVCGLRRVVEGVLALPASSVPAKMRAYFEQLQPHLPEVQTEERDGKRVLKPAKDYDPAGINNATEFPEGYAVWPYRMYGVGTKNGSVEANNTWDTMPEKRQRALGFMSWQCTPIYAALMGRHDDAMRLITEKLSDKNASARFPAFFGPGFDWIPDHNWGGSSMIGLHSMLIAPAENDVYLLPAWPREWDVEFKLHLPHNGTMQATVADGKLAKVKAVSASGGHYAAQLVPPAEQS